MRPMLKAPFWLVCSCVLILSAPASAQKGGGGGGHGTGSGGGSGGKGGPVSSPGTISGTPGYGSPGYGYGSAARMWDVPICEGTVSCPTTTPRPMPATPTHQEPTCFLPPVEGIRSSTVSVIRLEVPAKASREYEKACSDVHHKKYQKAEEHLHKAVNIYSAYTAAWVLLGQMQETRQKTNEAAASCSRARRIDSSYVPSYLCLAYLAATENKWTELAEITSHLLQLHPMNASNAYYYNALAYLHLNNLSSAETSALRGVGDTEKSHQPELHLLLAQIYERRGDRNSEIAELQEYLKRAPHSNQAAKVNEALKTISQNDVANRR